MELNMHVHSIRPVRGHGREQIMIIADLKEPERLFKQSANIPSEPPGIVYGKRDNSRDRRLGQICPSVFPS